MSINTNLEEKQQGIPIYQTNWFWGVIIGLVLILGAGWIIFSQNLIGDGATTAGGALEPAPIVGHPAPDFELKTVDGETISLSDFRGKPVIVNFWATWCGPCRAEFPEFQQAAVDNADTLVIIGVNNTSVDRVELIPDFLTEFGITFPIVLDTDDGATSKAYRILGLPTTIFIDSNGIVSEIFTGPLNKAYIESKISELTAS